MQEITDSVTNFTFDNEIIIWLICCVLFVIIIIKTNLFDLILFILFSVLWIVFPLRIIFQMFISPGLHDLLEAKASNNEKLYLFLVTIIGLILIVILIIR